MPETRTVTFNYTGAVQQWIVPNGVRQVTIDCYGAQGGDGIFYYSTIVPGGYGGRARATFPVTPGETLYIYVGGRGQYSERSDPSLAGWNGGGNAGIFESRGEYWYGGSGGGGASDVRRGGQTYSHRIIVAGGGGGSGSYFHTDYYKVPFLTDYLRGGAGGGLIGGNAGRYTSQGVYGGYGGTQTAGGKRGIDRSDGPYDGGFGYGGRAGSGHRTAGGGGGGWYGGGGGDDSGGGGGGSGYIAPEGINPYFETGVRAGHGLVIIQYEIIPPLYVRVNGQLRESESIHVRVNGQLREVDRIWTRVNGQLREV